MPFRGIVYNILKLLCNNWNVHSVENFEIIKILLLLIHLNNASFFFSASFLLWIFPSLTLSRSHAQFVFYLSKCNKIWCKRCACQSLILICNESTGNHHNCACLQIIAVRIKTFNGFIAWRSTHQRHAWLCNRSELRIKSKRRILYMSSMIQVNLNQST